MHATILANAPLTPRKWLRRAGIFGLWFFLIKGTLWLAAPLVFYWLA